MQIPEMKARLEEKIKALESEKSMLLEEVAQLREIVELSEKSKSLENDVANLKNEVKILRDRIPRELLRELGETDYSSLGDEDEETAEEECDGCDEEELL